MCKGVHRCPLCNRMFDCLIQTDKSNGYGECMDNLSSYCDKCQQNNLDLIAKQLGVDM